MTEDKLDPDQRIRLEALAQANATHGAPMTPRAINPEQVLTTAARYERFIRGDRADSD